MNLGGRFRDALERAKRALERLGTPWMLVGAIPVAAWGRARATTDIDFQTGLDLLQADVLERELGVEGFRKLEGPLTIPQKPLVLVKYWFGPEAEAEGIGADLFFATGPWQKEGLARRVEVAFGDRAYWVATPEDLLLYKLLAARARDLDDAAGLLEKRHESLDWRYIRESASRIGLGLPAFLDRVLEEFRREQGR